MKRFLLSLVLAIIPLRATSLADQTKALQKPLWETQVRAGLKDTYVDLAVLPAAKMLDSDKKLCQCWGLVFHDELGYHVQILGAEDYPKDFPKKLIPLHQRAVIAHEVLHIIFTENNMPSDVQDKFIGAVLPMLEVR